MKPKIAILASGEGTTAESFIRACAAGQIDAAVGLVISSREQAGILQRMASLNQELGLHIETRVINSTTHPAAPDEIVAKGCQTAAEEQAIINALQAGNFDLIMLMGYMKRIGLRLIDTFGWRPEYTIPYQAMMLNTHPGLLPETKGFYGIHVQEHVLEKGLPFGGQTLHVVAEDYDDGPVIAEHQVSVEPGDTPDSFFDRVKAVEKQYLPGDILAFIAARKQFLATKETA